MSSGVEVLLDEGLAAQTSQSRPTWRYNCELDERHVDAAILPAVPMSYVQEAYDQRAAAMKCSQDTLGSLAVWIRETLHQLPGGVDIARDVDDGGFTHNKVTPTLFSRWVDVENSTFVRFSESRTAMHNTMVTTKGLSVGAALRSPVMHGVVLEATNDPDSLDPRDAVSLAIYEFAKEEDARYPWIKPRPGRLFDLTPYRDTPFSVGPLYGGHPNEVTQPEPIQKALMTASHIIQLTVEQAQNL